MKSAIRNSFIVVIATLALLEIALQVFDPFGLVYLDDIRYMYSVAQPAPNGFKLPDGVTKFSHWQATIKDGRRVLPDSVATGRTVYFIGDSVTFGYGVEDSETWVNLLAREFGLNAINTAYPAFNRDNITLSLLGVPKGACVVYLAISNDAEPPVFWRNRPYFRDVRLPSLINALTPKPLGDVRFSDYWLSEIEKVSADYRLLQFQANYDFGTGARVVDTSNYGAVSWYDKHFSALGNVAFFEAVKEDFEQWVKGC